MCGVGSILKKVREPYLSARVYTLFLHIIEIYWVSSTALANAVGFLRQRTKHLLKPKPGVGWLQVDHNASRHVFSSASFREEPGLDIFVTSKFLPPWKSWNKTNKTLEEWISICCHDIKAPPLSRNTYIVGWLDGSRCLWTRHQNSHYRRGQHLSVKHQGCSDHVLKTHYESSNVSYIKEKWRWFISQLEPQYINTVLYLYNWSIFIPSNIPWFELT